MNRTLARLSLTFQVKAGCVTLEQQVTIKGDQITPERVAAAIELLQSSAPMNGGK